MPTRSSPNIVAIIQARMGSTRLPGKVLKTVMDKPLLEHQIDRLRRSRLLNDIVVATTFNKTDEPIVEMCGRLNVSCFRGSEHDVLSRYLMAADAYKADTIVRLTSDCPVIDPHVVDTVIVSYLDASPQCDYVSNFGVRTFPRGMDTEVLSVEALYEAYDMAFLESDREHVTPYLYRHDDRFRIANVTYARDESQHRWTVDTEEDLALIRLMFEALYPVKREFTLEDMLSLHQMYPEWRQINRHVLQKPIV